MPLKDHQKSKLYQWENMIVSPRCNVMISYNNSQMFVDSIWIQEKWQFPPKIVSLRGKALGRGNRSEIEIPRNGIMKWILLHEIAHVATSEFDNSCSNGHSSDFLGVYFYLLEKYCSISYPLLLYTADQANLKYNILAKPWFLD